MPILMKDFEILKEKALLKRPILREVLRKKGKRSLLQYVNQYVDVNLNPTIQSRQDEFLAIFREEAAGRLDSNIADSALKQLERYYFLSTADHHGPLCHPFFVNSNMLTAPAILGRQDPVLNNVIVLACANISVNNSSFPKGLFFHYFINKALQIYRLPFFSANNRSAIYVLPPYTRVEVEKIYNNLDVSFRKGDISPTTREKLHQLFDEIYLAPDVLASKSYSEQITRTNYYLWRKFFTSSQVTPPNLVYLEAESLVVKLLIQHHLYKDTVINHILFDPDYESYVSNYFEDIFGSFSRKEQSGTYLFWALPKGASSNLQLWRKGNFLVSHDESYKIELHPEVIQKAMEAKELIPNLLLDFITISFYYGLKCLGGFNQINYLTLMKNAYIKMNADLGNYRSIEVCARAQTKEICDGLTTAFLGYGNGEMTLATGLDLFLYGKNDTWQIFLEDCKNISFEEALSSLIPEIYRITYDKKEWDESLLSISDKDISRLLGLDKKLKPCVTLDS